MVYKRVRRWGEPLRRIFVTLTIEEHDALERWATAQERTPNAQASYVLKRGLAHWLAEKKRQSEGTSEGADKP